MRSRFAAGTLVLAALFGAGAARGGEEEKETKAAGPSPADTERAQAAFAAGMKKFEAGEFKAAYEDFEQSYEVVKSPNSHFMMARSMARMGQNELAYRELSRVIREAEAGGERYAATAESARAKREEIRPRVGLLRIDVSGLPKGSKVSIEGDPVEPDDLQDALPVLPGDVHVRAKLPTGEEIEKKVFVETGGEKDVRLAKAEPGETEPEPERSFIQRDDHHRYLIEATAEGFWTIVEPPGLPNQGVGPGLRVTIQLLPRGIFPGVNDGLGLGGGADWVLTSVPKHFWFPIYAQWNLWITPKVSVLLEPGVAIMTEGGGVQALVEVGGRYMLIDEFLSLTVRAGLPHVSAGLSAFF